MSKAVSNAASAYRVSGVSGEHVELTSLLRPEKKNLPLDALGQFEVYRASTLGVSVGDKVRFSLGGTAKNGKRRISNGRLDEIKAIEPNGDLVLQSGMTVDHNYGHLDLGYVITSHASQGKDRHLAIAAMGSQSLPAINAKQFYVTVSRGRDDVAIYVDDKAKVRQAIARSGEQLSATELITGQNTSPSQNRIYDDTEIRRSQTGRQIFQGFRDRFLNWWRSQTADRQSNRRGRGPAFPRAYPRLQVGFLRPERKNR